MNREELEKEIKGKSKEEIREFIINRLKIICGEAEELFVKEEEYEKASEIIKISGKYKNI